ncbi:AAA family ATPase [Nocardia puris]|uniref:AAA family ATPase n=1 Tax=Nocardia puris TaxID=208602 RepID=UPI001894802B|nr:AAA family ATPase [Nocardia puris]MBF6210166.1 AAA family ATPase [Nocardia puris]MBF6370402.1 AAA family ATPase [Nocardia puris]MBF6457925.1 AAA family ATPase [Nocardia puris]
MSQPRPEVVRPVTVAITGTHSTGKTTFLTRLADRLRRDRVNVAVVSDLGAQAQQLGLPILYNHTWASTLWIITRGISNEIQSWTTADVVLIDRAVPDALAYYEAALDYRDRRADPHRIQHLEDLIANHNCNYDLVLRTVLDNRLPLGLAKPRDTDMEFRALADQHVEKVLTRLDIEHDLLPAEGHDRVLVKALTFIRQRLDEYQGSV